MKKFIIITTLTLTTLLSSVTAFANTDVGKALPNKTSLNSTYAESYNELDSEQKKSIRDTGAYYLNGAHMVYNFDGIEFDSDSTCSSEITCRADFTINNVETDWIDKLSSDNTLNVRMLTINTSLNPGFISKDYLCIYGDKAEKWFMLGEHDFLPPSKSKDSSAAFKDYNPVFSSEEKGFAAYHPIVTLKKDYVDTFETDDFENIKFNIYYSDADWFYVDHFDFILNGLNQTVTWDDITYTPNFKAFFVQGYSDFINGGGIDERQVKFNEIYNNDTQTTPDKKDDTSKSDEKPAESPTPTKEPAATPAPTEKPSENPAPAETPVPTEKPSEPTIPSAEPTVSPTDTDGTQTAVYLNGQLLEFSESPVTFNDRVLVPMRKIFEALDADVDWNQDDMSVSAQKDGTLINMQIGSTLFQKDDSKITLDTAPILVNDTTMVPIRAIAEAFGANVVWNSVDKSVIIETN